MAERNWFKIRRESELDQLDSEIKYLTDIQKKMEADVEKGILLKDGLAQSVLTLDQNRVDRYQHNLKKNVEKYKNLNEFQENYHDDIFSASRELESSQENNGGYDSYVHFFEEAAEGYHNYLAKYDGLVTDEDISTIATNNWKAAFKLWRVLDVVKGGYFELFKDAAEGYFPKSAKGKEELFIKHLDFLKSVINIVINPRLIITNKVIDKDDPTLDAQIKKLESELAESVAFVKSVIESTDTTVPEIQSLYGFLEYIPSASTICDEHLERLNVKKHKELLAKNNKKEKGIK